MNKALIIKIISSEYTILLEDRSIQKAILAGKMRLDKHPVVGDYVEYIISDNKYVIQSILERRNYLIRPNLANIDNAIIMMSTKDPSFSYELVNRLIMLIEYADIRPIICISKADLGDNQEIEEIKTYYETMNYDVIISDISNDFRNLEGILENKITVLCGQSGVGKSSLLNKLQPELNLKTNEISRALNRGKHTTRHVELFEIYGGYIADTPGFSSLDLTQVDKDLLASKISVFKPYIGECRFNNCMHINEPDCKVKEAVDKGKIKQSFHKTYKDIIEFIISENLKGNRHRTLK